MINRFRTFFSTLLSSALALVALLASVTCYADDDLFIPVYTYRTGPFSNSGKPIADGISDYLNMLNARDGGVGGVKLKVEECELGVDEWAGVSCYKSALPKKPIVLTPWSTDVTKSLIPLSANDKIPVLSMMYGVSATSDGTMFPWAFNAPGNYSDSASILVQYVANQEGGFERLKNKKIGYLYLDYGWGTEPLPVLQRLAQDYDFDVLLYPVPLFELENQSEQWESITRDKPDYLIMYGWDVMQSDAVRNAVKNKFPMDRFIASWWLSEWDMTHSGVGAAATGLKMLNWNVPSSDYSFIRDIKKFVYGNQGTRNTETKLGSLLYNHGVYNAMLIAEGIRSAQRLTGKQFISAEDMRLGLENLRIDEARLTEMGMAGFAYPLELNCFDHNGRTAAFVQRFDGEKFIKVSNWIEPLRETVNSVLAPYKKKFLRDNPGWPLPTSPCPSK